ncbi:MAG: HEAT repeat domain-containing protein [Gemmataceae bacterium]|nr:HEAT repeat domain-containing protein [Gemmataceae bacterium]
MQLPSDRIRQLTHALTRPESAAAAAEALRGTSERAAIEGLVDLLYRAPQAKPAIAALAALRESRDVVAMDGVLHALSSPHAAVRVTAAQVLEEQCVPYAEDALTRLLASDESWIARRAALRALAALPERWQVLIACTDPHWRVRHALIQVLVRWGKTEAVRQEIDSRLARAGADVRTQGIRDYLTIHWNRGNEAAKQVAAPAAHPAWWDPDSAVLRRNLEQLDDTGRRLLLDAMPNLLGHADDRVRGIAFETLRDHGEVAPLVQALTWLDEPRAGAVEPVRKLFAHVDGDRVEEVARAGLRLASPSSAQLSWALDQIGPVLPPAEVQPDLIALMERANTLSSSARGALARLAGRWQHTSAESWLLRFLVDGDADVRLEALRGWNQRQRSRLDAVLLRRLRMDTHATLRAESAMTAVAQGDDVAALATDPDARVRSCLAECLVARGDPHGMLVRLQADVHPQVRAAALTPARAAALVHEPARETSWHVLARAARLARVPLWKLEPTEPWRSASLTSESTTLLRPRRIAPSHGRLLGPEALSVAPLGISGHYGLPVEGYVRAVEAGVNLFFWEPNYQHLTDFSGCLHMVDRQSLHFVAGTFEADGQRIERDAERALRMLKIDRLAVFLVFWVQGWNRISDDVRAALNRLQTTGKVVRTGLSTHSRPLAMEAMEQGWNPVMVRHSAAHRGAEAEVLPRAVARGTSVFTFNNTCYGRLLQSDGKRAAPTAADCYRYTLAQPGVTACWSAPATLQQLEENLQALHSPDLPSEQIAELRNHGDRVYREDTIFRQLVRSV